MTIYLDESGTHGGSPLAVLAGYAILPDDWLGFELDWQQMLDDACIPELHMNEFFSEYGDLRWIPVRDRNALFERAISIIARYANFGVAFGVDAALYENSWGSVPNEQQVSPYALCFMTTAAACAAWGNASNYSENISYMLDSGNGHISEVYMGHEAMKHMQRSDILNFRVGTLAVESDDEYGALQAADMCAYIFRHQALDTLRPDLVAVKNALWAAKSHAILVLPLELLKSMADLLPDMLTETKAPDQSAIRNRRERREALERMLKNVIGKRFPKGG